MTEDALRAQIRARKERRKKKASVRLSRSAAAMSTTATATAAAARADSTPAIPATASDTAETLRTELRSFAHKEVAAAIAVVIAGTAPAPS